MITIRPARRADSGTIAAIHVAAWEHSYRGLLPDVAFEGMTIPNRTRAWEDIFEESHHSVYVAERDGECAGFAHGGPARKGEDLGQDMQLYAIYVAARAKRQGIGTMLLRTVMGDFVSVKKHSACVWTLQEAIAARAFYERHGAELFAERLEHRPGYDRVIVGYVWPDLRRAHLLGASP